MLKQDFRVAVRWLRANPGFTAAAVLVLALGLGAATATFTVVHSVALRPLSLAEPERIIRIWSNQLEGNVPFFSVSLPDFADWRAQSRTLSRLAAYDAQRPMIVRSRVEQDVVLGSDVTGELFPLLGVGPVLGRWIASTDAQPGADQVVVIAHGVWQRRFGGRSDVLGQTIVLDDQPAAIVGVMPKGFAIPNNPAEVWRPMQAPIDPRGRGTRFLRVLGQLRSGVSIDDARSDLTRIARQLGERHPESNRGWGVSVRPIGDTIVTPELRQALIILLGAVGLVLLIACANVAGLLMSRAAARRREMAVRTALGASRGALVRQMLVECALLAIASGVAGVLIAMWSVDGLVRIAVNTIPRLDEVAFRTPVVVVAIATTGATVILFGLIPALQVSRDALGSLRSRESSSAPGASRSRDVLVVAEVALAVILLVGAGLLTRSFLRLQDRDLGFDPERLLVLEFATPADPVAAARREAQHAELLARLGAVPGVGGAAGVVSAPFSGRNPGMRFLIVGRPTTPEEVPPNADYRVVTPGYLRVMGIPLLRGRDIADTDGPASPAVVISESAARQYWSGADPLGTQIVFGGYTLTVVGIAADARYAAIDAPNETLRPMIYLPDRLMPQTPLQMVVRTRARPDTLVPGIRAAAAAAAPAMPIARLNVMTDMLADARGPQRFYTTVLGAFASIALVLAAAGLWALIAYSITTRTREIGIRVALGAAPGDVLRTTAGRGIGLAVAGLAIGLAGALGLSGVLQRLLFSITPTDRPTFAAIVVVFVGVAGAASVLPARRALRIDPVEALRSE